jgi:hypothetical protein
MGPRHAERTPWTDKTSASNQKSLRQSYRLFLPRTLLPEVGTDGISLPSIHVSPAAVLLLEICRASDSEGDRVVDDDVVFKLNSAVNEILCAITAAIDQYGGDVVQIQENVVVCLFSNSEIPPSGLLDAASDSAILVLASLRDADLGAFRLRGGLAVADACFVLLGPPHICSLELPDMPDHYVAGQCSMLVAGDAHSRAWETLQAASLGEVRVFGGVEALCGMSQSKHSRSIRAAAKQSRDATDTPSRLLSSNSSGSSRSTSPPGSILGVAFLSTPILHALQDMLSTSDVTDAEAADTSSSRGSCGRSPAAKWRDIRKVSTVSVSLPELCDLDLSSSLDLVRLNDVFRKLADETSRLGGSCRRFLVDSRRCVFTAVFGSLKTSDYDMLRAALAALSFEDELALLGLEKFQIGVSNSAMLCGVYGPADLRLYYVMLDLEVAAASELMLQAHLCSTLVDRPTWLMSRSVIEYGGSQDLAPGSLTAQCFRPSRAAVPRPDSRVLPVETIAADLMSSLGSGSGSIFHASNSMAGNISSPMSRSLTTSGGRSATAACDARLVLKDC